MSYNNIMGMTVKATKDKKYLYFQAGKATIYIGPKDDTSKVKTENVIRALDYSRGRVQHYLESVDELIALLPEPLRKQQLLKQKSILQEGRSMQHKK